MKGSSIVIVIDNVSTNISEELGEYSIVLNEEKNFLDMVSYLNNNYEFEYILLVVNGINVDKTDIEQVKQKLKDSNNRILIRLESIKDIDSIEELLRNIENIDLCLIKKECISYIGQNNNLGNKIDLLFTELILKVKEIEILNKDKEKKSNIINLDNHIEKLSRLISLYEEQNKYTYYEIRYIKDIRIIIDELKKILNNKNKVIEYLKKLETFAKEIINVDVSELGVIEELLIYQIGNKEFENAFKTLQYLNRENELLKKDIRLLEEKENEFYKSKYEEILKSKSWAITRPIRMPKIWIKKIKNKLKGY